MSTDDPLERENRQRENDPVWANQFTLTAVIMAAVAGAGVVLALGWRPDYPLSVIAAVTAVGFVLGLALRRSGPAADGQTHGRVAVLLAAPVVGLLTQLVVIATRPDARVDRLTALLLVGSAVFAGLVLVSAEALLEFVIAGLVGLILDRLLAVGPDVPYRFLLLWPAYAIPQLVGALLLPRILKRSPSGLLGTGLLAIFWTVIGQQPWSPQSVGPAVPGTLAAVVVVVVVRVLIGRLPVPPLRKFGYLFALTLVAGGIVLLST